MSTPTPNQVQAAIHGTRCSWCGVALRWWQVAFCRTCAYALDMDVASPPCPRQSRRDAEPDRLFDQRAVRHDLG